MSKLYRINELVNKLLDVRNSLVEIYCIDNENTLDNIIKNINDVIYSFYNYPALKDLWNEEDRNRLSKLYLNSLYGISAHIDTDMVSKKENVKNELDKIILKSVPVYIRSENRVIKDTLEYIIKTSESIKESL